MLGLEKNCARSTDIFAVEDSAPCNKKIALVDLIIQPWIEGLLLRVLNT